jgi:hypothetical protein
VGLVAVLALAGALFAFASCPVPALTNQIGFTVIVP